MARKQNIFVVPKPAGGWAVKRGGNPKPLSNHRTQANANEAAAEVAKEDGVDRVTLGKDGTIKSKDSFGHDPYPPKDTEH